MILLDTMVLSELRKRRPHPKVVAWLRSQAPIEVFISVVSLGEIERGIHRAADRVFAVELAAWLEALIRFYADRPSGHARQRAALGPAVCRTGP